MKNPKKGPFDLSVDLDQIPGFRARFGRVGPHAEIIDLKQEYVSTLPAQDAEKDLRAKFGSGQNQFTLPSVILRRNGKRV